MSQVKCLFFILIVIAIPSISFANPVSFKDGWGLMPTYTPDWSDLDINYSLTNKDAVGVSNFYREGRDSTSDFAVVRYNHLLKRWNELDSQANIYASIGVGGRHDSVHDDSFASFGALEGDYETRRIYTLFAAETLQSPNSVQYNRLRYRAGFSPYKAPIDMLQTWVIGQVDYMPEMNDKVEVTPLLRFFYNNLALEIGSSLNGKIYLGAMAHF